MSVSDNLQEYDRHLKRISRLVLELRGSTASYEKSKELWAELELRVTHAKSRLEAVEFWEGGEQ